MDDLDAMSRDELVVEYENRAMRSMGSMRYLPNAARLPVHRDLARFDFETTNVDLKLTEQLAAMQLHPWRAQRCARRGDRGPARTIWLPSRASVIFSSNIGSAPYT